MKRAIKVAFNGNFWCSVIVTLPTHEAPLHARALIVNDYSRQACDPWKT